jgi:histidinol dehydrogenase
MSLQIRKLDSSAADFDAALAAVLAFEASEDEAIERAVVQILADVKRRGDAAVLEYTHRFDRLDATSVAALELPLAELEAALESLEPKQRAALEAAAARVRAYHEKQKIECGSHSWQYTEADGTVLGQRVTPLDRAGIYVPGGKAAYPSSVLMNAVPARVAGVREIVMVVPTPDGVKNPLVLAAALLGGVDRVFTIGGAQAIGALAYGTETVPAVDKICGPGNAYVASAKRRVFGAVGIDMIAGPSEILVLCDGTTDPRWVAMDLFSQAEHDELAQSILLCPDETFITRVEEAIEELLPTMPRRDVIRRSLEGRGALVKVQDMAEACAIANRIAPEHLEISTLDPQQWAKEIRHAGAVFVGRFTSESLGDYCAGPNHVLPTSRTARFSSPLGVYDFFKRSSLIEVSAEGAQTLGEIAAELAYGEGLQAHAKSAEYRMKQTG